MSDKQMTTRNVEQTYQVDQAAPIVWATPSVDIFETDNEILLLADMPGIAEQSLQLEVVRGVLTLEAEKQVGDDTTRYGYYRQFKLSDRIDADAGNAELKNGVVTLRLPKSEAAKPKKIVVKTLH